MDYGTGKLKEWMKKLDLPDGRVNPVSFLKLVRKTKTRVEKFNADTPKAMKDGAFGVIKANAGKDGDYPLYPSYLAGVDPASRVSIPQAVKPYFEEFWDLHEDLAMYFGIQGLIPSQVYGRGVSEEECVKRCVMNGEDIIKDLDEFIRSLERVQTRDAIKARMEALMDWSKFQLGWREEWLKTAETPDGQPIPHTPDAIGYLINHSDPYNNSNSSLSEYLRKKEEEEAERRRPPPKKPRKGKGGGKVESGYDEELWGSGIRMCGE
jgi:hypothetical protein